MGFFLREKKILFTLYGLWSDEHSKVQGVKKLVKSQTQTLVNLVAQHLQYLCFDYSLNIPITFISDTLQLPPTFSCKHETFQKKIVKLHEIRI